MWLGGERVDIRLKAPPAYAHTLDNVRGLPLRAQTGEIIPLGELAEVSLAFAHDAIFRHNTLRAITVRADTAEGYSSVALEDEARSALATLSLPPGVSLRPPAVG